MAASARFGDQVVVNSFNLFVDTDRITATGNSKNRGDDTTIHFDGNTIVAGDGELIKMTLLSFDMHNNFYTMDRFNSKVRFLHKGGDTTTHGAAAAYDGPGRVDLFLPFKNYGSLADIALEFACLAGKQIAARATLASGVAPKVAVTHIFNVFEESPSHTLASQVAVNAADLTSASYEAKMNQGTKLTLGQTGGRLLDVTIGTFASNGTTVHNHGITSFAIQCLDEDGDAHLILGAERFDSPYNYRSLTSTADIGSSFKVTIAATTIRIQGYFPMQLVSDPYVYLRSDTTQAGGLETAGMNSAALRATDNSSDLTSSNIFAKIRRDTAFCTYNTSNDEFFMNIQQRKVSSLRLYLTDSKNRPVGQTANVLHGTAAGLIADENTSPDFVSGYQDTLGNLCFSCVIRVDIIKMSQPAKLETTPLPLPLPARKAQQGVIFGFTDYGMAKSGV